MNQTLKELIQRTPIYPALRAVEQRIELKNWERKGYPNPPPHVVKQRAIKKISADFGLQILVETGTYYGDMVEAMKKHFTKVYSIELSKELYGKAKNRFKGSPNIEIIHGDSGIELEKLINKIDQPALFWLDGHYSSGVTAKGEKDTPIFEELTHILNCQQAGNVILIDDARYFGTDPAYPSIEELSQFVKANRPNMNIDIENDIIRIRPSR